jgi:predicted lipoprotein with Yx(FWY)xxD motif
VYAGGVVAIGIALLVAACGSSGSGSNTQHASTSGGVMVKTANGSRGTYLVGPSGRALYLFMADSAGKSNCSGACASVWPPLTTTGSPGASGSAMAADLGTITATKQVTYKGHPLYYYSADSGPSTTTGEGLNSYGAKWWLVAPSGAAITKSGAASSSGSSSGGGYTY